MDVKKIVSQSKFAQVGFVVSKKAVCFVVWM